MPIKCFYINSIFNNLLIFKKTKLLVFCPTSSKVRHFHASNFFLFRAAKNKNFLVSKTIISNTKLRKNKVQLKLRKQNKMLKNHKKINTVVINNFNLFPANSIYRKSNVLSSINNEYTTLCLVRRLAIKKKKAYKHLNRNIVRRIIEFENYFTSFYIDTKNILRLRAFLSNPINVKPYFRKYFLQFFSKYYSPKNTEIFKKNINQYKNKIFLNAYRNYVLSVHLNIWEKKFVETHGYFPVQAILSSISALNSKDPNVINLFLRSLRYKKQSQLFKSALFYKKKHFLATLKKKKKYNEAEFAQQKIVLANIYNERDYFKYPTQYLTPQRAKIESQKLVLAVEQAKKLVELAINIPNKIFIRVKKLINFVAKLNKKNIKKNVPRTYMFLLFKKHGYKSVVKLSRFLKFITSKKRFRVQCWIKAKKSRISKLERAVLLFFKSKRIDNGYDLLVKFLLTRNGKSFRLKNKILVLRAKNNQRQKNLNKEDFYEFRFLFIRKCKILLIKIKIRALIIAYKLARIMQNKKPITIKKLFWYLKIKHCCSNENKYQNYSNINLFPHYNKLSNKQKNFIWKFYRFEKKKFISLVQQTYKKNKQLAEDDTFLYYYDLITDINDLEKKVLVIEKDEENAIEKTSNNLFCNKKFLLITNRYLVIKLIPVSRLAYYSYILLERQIINALLLLKCVPTLRASWLFCFYSLVFINGFSYRSIYTVVKLFEELEVPQRFSLEYLSIQINKYSNTKHINVLMQFFFTIIKKTLIQSNYKKVWVDKGFLRSAVRNMGLFFEYPHPIFSHYPLNELILNNIVSYETKRVLMRDTVNYLNKFKFQIFEFIYFY